MILCAAKTAKAQTIIISTSDNQITPGFDNQGWWSVNRTNEYVTENYLVGISPDSKNNDVKHNFFTFDLSQITKVVISARLELTRFGYNADSDQETLGLFDVSTNAITLNTTTGVSSIIFDDLGSGNSYGEMVITSNGLSSDIVSAELNVQAISDINASLGGWFSIGGSLLTPGSPNYGGSETLFGYSHESDGIQQLVLEVIPEPASLILMTFGSLLVFKRK